MCIKVLNDNGVSLEKDRLRFVSGFYNDSVYVVMDSPRERYLMHRMTNSELVTLLNKQHEIIRRQSMQLSCYEKFDFANCLEIDLTFGTTNGNN